MRFVIDARVLRNGLRNQVARRSTLPIIEHVVIAASADDNTVTVESTDTEKYVTATLPAAVSEAGAATLRPDQLKGLLARLDGDLHVAHEAGRVRLSQGRNGTRSRQYTFDSMNAADWPGFREQDARVVPFDPAALALAIDNLAYCADAANPDKPFAWGLQVRPGYAAAQDHTRMALLPWETELPDMVIPLDSLPALRPLLDAPNVTAQVYGEGPHALELFTDTDRVLTKLVVAQCPPLLQTIDKMDELGVLASFDAAEARAALARVNPLGASQTNRNDVGLDVIAQEGRVVLCASNGHAEDEFTADDTNTNLPECHINGVYLADALQQLEGRVTWTLMHLPGSPSPATRLSCEGRQDIHLFAHRLSMARSAAA